MCMSKVSDLQKELDEKMEAEKSMAGSVHSGNALEKLYEQCQITGKGRLKLMSQCHGTNTGNYPTLLKNFD